MKRILFCMLAMIVMFVLVTPAHALLINRGTDTLSNRLIYDTDLDITWYDYTNAATTWQNQVNWASGLSVDFGSTTYDDWRLPTTPGTTFGFTSEGEMGYLYYTELDIDGGGSLNNSDNFQDLISSIYWSGTEYSANTNYAWSFYFTIGSQYANLKNYNVYGLAVRSGDVAAADPIPEPTTIALLGIGLAGMGVYGVRRRRQHR